MADRHLVLVPGFIGFDALGQIRYYCGVTALFQGWKPDKGSNVTLHYFDNFPTASVATRAERLKVYLAKKLARREIAEGDAITLIGHSTGGLDIRKLLLLLKYEQPASTIVDDRFKVQHHSLLQKIDKVVFLSVPHYGTNIADYTHSFKKTVQGEVGNLRDALALNQGPLAQLRNIVTRSPEEPPRAHVLQAILDTLNETDVRTERDEKQSAHEREARSELLLWLDHMAHDFGAIDDLRSGPAMMHPEGSPAGAPTKGRLARAFEFHVQQDDSDLPSDFPKVAIGTKSPAHFTVKQRQYELESWRKIEVRSYANFVHPDRVAKSGAGVAVVESLRMLASKPLNLAFGAVELFADTLGLGALAPGIANSALSLVALGPIGLFFAAVYLRPSFLFESIYALCMRDSGPFEEPDPLVDASYFPPAHDAQIEFGEKLHVDKLSKADNDGVVNTLSMFWPRPRTKELKHQIFLVQADHGDIVGHYDLQPNPGELLGDRLYGGYDMFQSKSGFKQEHFEKLWNDIFAFATK